MAPALLLASDRAEDRPSLETARTRHADARPAPKRHQGEPDAAGQAFTWGLRPRSSAPVNPARPFDTTDRLRHASRDRGLDTTTSALRASLLRARRHLCAA